MNANINILQNDLNIFASTEEKNCPNIVSGHK